LLHDRVIRCSGVYRVLRRSTLVFKLVDIVRIDRSVTARDDIDETKHQGKAAAAHKDCHKHDRLDQGIADLAPRLNIADIGRKITFESANRHKKQVDCREQNSETDRRLDKIAPQQLKYANPEENPNR